MPGIAQRRTKLGGNWYDRGAVVPDDVISDRTVAMGLVTRSAAGGDPELAAELKRTKAALAEAHKRLAAAEGRKAPAASRSKAASEPGGTTGDE